MGYWYARGPADKEYSAGDPAVNLLTVVSDKSQFVAHVTVENAAGQQFPAPCSLIDEIVSPAGHIYSQSEQRFVKIETTALV